MTQLTTPLCLSQKETSLADDVVCPKHPTITQQHNKQNGIKHQRFAAIPQRMPYPLHPMTQITPRLIAALKPR